MVSTSSPMQSSSPDEADARDAVRQVSVLDARRPNGPEGMLEVRGECRVERLLPTGAHVALADASVAATVDFADDHRIVRLETTPALDGIDALVGRSAAAGFRSALLALIADGAA